MDFIHKHEVPSHKTVTYANFVCDYCPLKSEPFRVRMTVGGDKLSYDDDTGSPTASILETKLLANSIILDDKKHNSKFCAIDLKDFFILLWKNLSTFESTKNISPHPSLKPTIYKKKFHMTIIFIAE